MEPLPRELIASRIEELQALDAVSRPLQTLAQRIAPGGSTRKDVLSGTWLGHPLHPLLTDVVIGSWTGAVLLDVFGGEGTEKAADRLVGVGALSALPTAVSGLSDWAELWGGTQRLGIVHATGNAAALSLFTLSWFARRRGRRGLGVLLSLLGFGVATGSAYLGGHLSYGKGVGVDQTVFEDFPAEWTPVLDETELEEGKPVGAQANGTGVLLVRQEGRIHAMADKCSHRGCPLHDGEFDGETITCPCHGSTFRLDGSLVHGPATAPQPPLEARVRNGKVEVRAPA